MLPPKRGDTGARGCPRFCLFLCVRVFVSLFVSGFFVWFFFCPLSVLQHQQASLKGTDTFGNTLLLSRHFQVNSDVVSELFPVFICL